MNELQFSGFGYKQSFGPLHPVLAICSRRQTKSFEGRSVSAVEAVVLTFVRPTVDKTY